jgi:hypothetical protein
MSADPVSLPQGDQWKNVDAVQAWKAGRRKSLEKKWGSKWAPPLLSGIVQAAIRQEDPDFAIARELVQWDEETLAHRARRLENEGRQRKPLKPKGGCRHTPPAMLAKDGDVWLVSPIGRRATPAKLAKSKAMWDRNLHAKAERELACGLLGGPVECKNGHRFRTDYECGNRYCAGGCGKKAATRLFAKHKDRLFFVATRLLMCRGSDSWGNGCDECSQAIEEKRLPHWLPPKGKKPRVVLATIDFTLINTGHAGPDLMRLLNHYIKKFARAIEKRFGIRRSEYGLAYCDELGANNTNAHAHGIYVGPWLPQESKQLSRLWKEITGGSFIIHIKYAENFHRALFHAVKYPAKFVDRSTPERLAELERIFHRVRRFHTLASFYAPEAPEERAPEVRKCPICEAPLLKMGPWEPIAAMARRGLKNLATVKAEMERERGPTGAGPPALINHTAERAAGSDSQSAAF